MGSRAKKCYLLSCCWGESDLTDMFYKKCFWELDPGKLDNSNFRMLASIKTGDYVLLVRVGLNSEIGKGRYLGITKKVDIHKNRIYIRWTSDNVSNANIVTKTRACIEGPHIISFKALRDGSENIFKQ